MTIDASVLAAFLQPSHIIIVIILYLLGLGLKQYKSIKDNFIPVILTVTSLVLCLLLSLSENALPITFQGTMGLIFNIIVQTVCCVAAAVYFNQIGKQLLKLKFPEKNSTGSD